VVLEPLAVLVELAPDAPVSDADYDDGHDVLDEHGRVAVD